MIRTLPHAVTYNDLDGRKIIKVLDGKSQQLGLNSTVKRRVYWEYISQMRTWFPLGKPHCYHIHIKVEVIWMSHICLSILRFCWHAHLWNRCQGPAHCHHPSSPPRVHAIETCPTIFHHYLSGLLAHFICVWKADRHLWIFTTTWVSSIRSEIHDKQLNVLIAKNIRNNIQNQRLLEVLWRGLHTQLTV